MFKKSLLVATSIALTIAMSSLTQAQSMSMGNGIYGNVVYGEPVVIQSYASMPIVSMAAPNPIYEIAPPVSSHVETMQVSSMSNQQVSAVSPVVAPSHHVEAYPNPPHPPVMPTMTQQPVCLSGG